LTTYRKYREKPFFLSGWINIMNIKGTLRLTPYSIDISNAVEETGKNATEEYGGGYESFFYGPLLMGGDIFSSVSIA